jgi:DNA-binding MarR family transcriptional regulator
LTEAGGDTEAYKPAADVRDLFRGRGIAFLVSQVGAHSSRLWAKRIGEIGLDSRQVMLFWNVAMREGRSQRALADALGLPGSRVVGLVDELEQEGWLERRTNERDRRARALHLTPDGHEMLDQIMALALEHEAELGAGLSAVERTQLTNLLATVAAAQGLIPTVHPDF